MRVAGSNYQSAWQEHGFPARIGVLRLAALAQDDRQNVSNLAKGYNGISNENLGDPGFAGGAAVGAGRPEPSRAAAAYRAIGDEVPSAAIRSAIVGDGPIHGTGAITSRAGF